MSNLAGRLVNDEAEARACFAEMQAQGLTIYTYARTRGIAAWSLYRWRDRLAAPRLPAVAGFVELAPASPPALSPRYELILGPTRIVVGDDFQEQTLARLLHLVQSC
jgi:hypothetical protein